MKILSKIIILLIYVLLLSCGLKEMEFDKSKWNKSFDGFYEYRENMVQDVMKNHLKKGMELSKVIELLGEPKNYHNENNLEIVYKITVNYGIDIDPIEVKELYIKFDKDSTITNFKLKHWKR